eukprot:861946-Amphidinium_carterae.1
MTDGVAAQQARPLNLREKARVRLAVLACSVKVKKGVTGLPASAGDSWSKGRKVKIATILDQRSTRGRGGEAYH